MKLSKIVTTIEKCRVYNSLLDGLELMIRKAPENDKKEMLKDVIKFGKELAKDYERFSGGNEYLQAVNFALEGERDIANRRIKELEIEIEKFKEGI
jgi:hypothetical protein